MRYGKSTWNSLTKEQRKSVLNGYRDYNDRKRDYKSTNKKYYKPAVVISTTVINEPSFKEQYHNFLLSPYWKKRRDIILKRYKNCAICHSKVNLNVHHITYKNKYDPELEEVAVLCQFHHNKFHRIYGIKFDMTYEWGLFLEIEKPHGGAGFRL